MSALTASFPTIDLSRLAAPVLVDRLSYQQCFDALLADFRVRAPDFDALLPSDPAIKALEVAAYRETLLRAAIDDAGQATMLAFARGANLDQLGAFYGLHRLIVAPATDTDAAILESDDELRARLQAAPELLAGPGLTGGGYRVAVLTLAPELKDVAVIKRGGGRVDLVLLARAGDGIVDAATVDRVRTAFAGDDAAQLTDIVTVRAADILLYTPTVTVQIRSGPDPVLIRDAAEASIRSYAAARHHIGLPVYAQMIASAASIGGVERAIVDIGDVVPTETQAAYLTTCTVIVQVLGQLVG
ncbi:baseplate assembly protein [Sphingomonas oligophenolica]|uniref:baseplate assembly protein n=1 Tax=Sphingomonas oligophenolica TaxID=301154 RepID=UPI0013870DEB|nr:baseplate J/gp47 family protein [Sphingomonas oligophenolica]